MNATKVILKNYKLFNDDPIDNVSIGFDSENVFLWNIILIGPKDTPYEGGIFNAKLKFPNTYPNYPPELIFINDIYHPNIYEDGRVCISILHPPGDDKWGYESAAERWRPVHSVNSIMLSIISMLSEPNDDSPANIDAGKIWREDKKLFQHNVNLSIRKTLE